MKKKFIYTLHKKLNFTEQCPDTNTKTDVVVI